MGGPSVYAAGRQVGRVRSVALTPGLSVAPVIRNHSLRGSMYGFTTAV